MISPNKHRRNQILEIATKLFASKGYHGATLDEVAEQLGVTKASLYYYFRSKEQLLKEICINMQEKMNNNVRELVLSEMSPVYKLRALIKAQLIFVSTNRDISKVVFDEAEALGKAAYKRIYLQSKLGEKFVQDIIEEGVKCGCFAVDDVKMASFLILSACHWIYKWYRPDGRLTSDEIADRFINILENGYLKQATKASDRQVISEAMTKDTAHL
jgi:AcrR family transcriptional regulator